MSPAAKLGLTASLFLVSLIGFQPLLPAQNQPESYYQKGRSLQAQGKYDSAIYYLNKTAELARQKGQWKTYADSRLGQGQACRLAFQADTAFGLASELLELAGQRTDLPAETAIGAHQLRGQLFFDRGQYNEALAAHQRALQLLGAQTGNNLGALVAAYQEVGRILLVQARPDQALSYLVRALGQQDALNGKKHLVTAAIYEDMAQAYHALNSPHEAIGYAEQALQIRTGLLGKNHPDQSLSCYRLGKLYQAVQQPGQAVRYLRWALQLQTRGGQGTPSLGTARTMLALGRSYATTGEDSTSWACYREAFRTYGQLLRQRHVSLLGSSLDEEAAVWEIPAYNDPKGHKDNKSGPGTVTLAYQSWTQAWALLESLSAETARVLGVTHPDVAAFKENMGYLYARQFVEVNIDRKSYRERFGTKVLKFVFKVEDKVDEYEIKESEKAASLYEQARQIRVMGLGDQHPKLALNYLLHADLLKQVNELYVQYQQEAFERYNKAIQEPKNTKPFKVGGITVYDENKSTVRVFRNRYQEALQQIAENDHQVLRYYQQAVAAVMPFHARAGYHENPALPDIPDSRLPEQVLNYEMALKALQEKIAFMSQVNARPQLQPIPGIDYTEPEKKTDNPNPAASAYRPADAERKYTDDYLRRKAAYNRTRPRVGLTTSYEAVGSLDRLAAKMSRSLVNEKDQILLASRTKEINLLAMHICIELARRNPPGAFSEVYAPSGQYHERFRVKKAATPLHEAFDYAEKSKATVLLRTMLAAQSGATHRATTAGQRDLEAAILTLRSKVAEKLARRHADDSLRANQLQDSIFRLSEQLLASRRGGDSTTFTASGQLRYTGIAQIQQALDDSTAILAYSMDSDRLLYFLITRNDFDFLVWELVDGDLEAAIVGIRQAIHLKTTEDYIEHALLLKKMLVPKLDDQISKLVILPDGALNTLPFEALLTKRVRMKDKDKPEHFDYLLKSYRISYAYSATLLFRPPHQAARGQGLVAFAPVFSREGSAGLALSNETLIRAWDDSTGMRTALAGQRSVRPLPATEKEVESLYQVFTRHKQPAQIYTHAQATEYQAKSPQLSGYKYVHLATHGFVNLLHPERSGVMLTANKDSTEDGILYSNELYNLPLQADLVTLSACETGLGRIEAGEGVIGLPRALLYAGSRNVLVSLWKVVDRSTADLMVDFYDQLLTGHSYAGALRQAKLRMMASPEYAHPYYWSAFILIGR